MTHAETARPDALEAARAAVEVASDYQAADIVLLDVRGVASFADYLVIMSADNPRQLQTLSEELDYALDHNGWPLHHREGTIASGWVLLDFTEVVVHIFSKEQRAFYRLEQLWSAGRQVVRIQ